MRMPQLGGFFAQGKTAVRAKELVDDAQAMVDAGCFSIMCEVTSQEVNEYLAQVLPVPVISLGAGLGAHGVHIITSDLMHLYEEHTPRHSKVYTDLIPIIEDVFIRYRDEVKAQIYPGPEHTVFMSDEEALKFAKAMKWDYKLAQLDAKASAAGKKKTRKKTSLPAKKPAAKKPAKKKTKKK
jgi:3-methyl-2-oxobutanoate hydroxymethyltransferase